TDLKSPSSSAAAAAPPAAPGQQPKTTTTEVFATGPEIDTLSDATAAEAYTPPPKPVEKRLKRRRPRSKESLKRREERRRIKDLENRRRMKTFTRESDIVAESAPTESVPNENNEKAKDEGSEDFLNKLLKGQSAPSPLLDEEGNPILEEDPYETLPLVRIIRAVTNLVAYLMDNPV
ncbi:hypothetical protein PMAYCL1PPCAC_23246, partial [Pristionchus mayeri]